MNSYNGFRASQRMAAYRWLMAEYAAGRRVRPTSCDACGQTEGVIEAHSEDYSRPYGDHIGQHGVCWCCHMMIHCRFRSMQAWDAYRAAVAGGAIFRPFSGKAFNVFSRMFLTLPLPEPDRYRPAPGPTLLDRLR